MNGQLDLLTSSERGPSSGSPHTPGTTVAPPTDRTEQAAPRSERPSRRTQIAGELPGTTWEDAFHPTDLDIPADLCESRPP